MNGTMIATTLVVATASYYGFEMPLRRRIRSVHVHPQAEATAQA